MRKTLFPVCVFFALLSGCGGGGSGDGGSGGAGSTVNPVTVTNSPFQGFFLDQVDGTELRKTGRVTGATCKRVRETQIFDAKDLHITDGGVIFIYMPLARQKDQESSLGVLNDGTVVLTRENNKPVLTAVLGDGKLTFSSGATPYLKYLVSSEAEILQYFEAQRRCL